MNEEQYFYLFSNIETGKTWSVKAETIDEALEKLPEDADWDDWFRL